MRRIYILDIFRGLSLIFVIFFHASVYNFANIHKLDFSHPPLIVVLISFLMLWGGIFIIYSTFINVNMFYMRVEKDEKKNSVKFLIVGSILYIILHFLLTLVLGRWNVDFIHNQSHMPLLAGSLREMKLIFPDISKYFEGSSISTIAINLIFVSLIINRLVKNQDKKNEIRNYLLVCLFGVFIMLISFVRIFLNPYTQIFIEQQHYIPAIIFSFFIANPYPIFPYLAYGLFGAILGVMFFKKKYSLIKRNFI